MTDLGLIAIGAGIAILGAGASSIGEAMIASKAIEGMTRNPEMADKLRSSMILAIALDETCGIYALLVSILIIFVLGMR
jgi:F-type H+-transporting ATPase subunit c